MSSIGREIASGVKWNVIATVITQVMNTCLMLFLVKFLSPDDFGLYGMVSVFIGLSTILIDLGFTAVIIQTPELSHSMKSTIFWGNIVLGGILFFLLYFSSGTIASFYGREELEPICEIFGLSFVFSSFGMTNNALAQKRLQFNVLAKANIFSKFFSSISAIVFVLYGYGVWALVASNLIATFSLSVFLMIFNRWLPGFIFRVSDLRSVFKFGLEFSFVSLFLYAIRKLDEVLLGKYGEAAELGLYNTASRMVFMPVTLLKGKVVNVLFPAFSKIQDEVGRVREISLKLTRLLSMFAVPILCLIWLGFPDFIRGYMGEEWQGLILIVQWLVIAYAFDLVQFPRAIMLSQGKSTAYMKMMVAYRSFTFLGVASGLFLGGINGLLYGLTLTSFLAFLPMIWYTGKIINLPASDYLRELSPPVFLCIASTVIAVFLTGLGAGSSSFILQGFLKIACFISAYILLSMFLMKPTVISNILVVSQILPERLRGLLSFTST